MGAMAVEWKRGAVDKCAFKRRPILNTVRRLGGVLGADVTAACSARVNIGDFRRIYITVDFCGACSIRP